MKAENTFRILAFGDVIGEPGRKALMSVFYKLRTKYQPDLTVINGENSAQGFGVTQVGVKQFLDSGFDVITTGNHVWQKKEIFEFIDRYPTLLRPINYPAKTPGHGSCVIDRAGVKVAVVNLMGRIYMDPIDCPFQALEREVEKLKAEGVKIILVDFHAEATSEKQMMGWHFDGKVSAVWGTHTHTPTADEKILHKKTAYISDIGMCGSVDSVIGMKTTESYRKVIQHLPVRFSPEENGAMEVQGIVLDIHKETGEALLISRIHEKIG